MAQVLIVDADAASRRILRVILEDQGHDVDEVEGGSDGLRRLDTDPPDLVITELYLEEVDGIELLRAVKERWADRPVVVSSERSHVAYLQVAGMAMHLGADGFLEKPLDRHSGVGTLVEGLVA